MDNFTLLENKQDMVCPFRTQIIVTNTVDKNNIPSQIQTTYFPECYYGNCPYYNSKAIDNSERCFRAVNV